MRCGHNGNAGRQCKEDRCQESVRTGRQGLSRSRSRPLRAENAGARWSGGRITRRTRDMPNAMRAVLACALVVAGAGGTRRLAAQNAGGHADSAAVVALEHRWLSLDDSAALEQILAPDFLHPVSTGD